MHFTAVYYEISYKMFSSDDADNIEDLRQRALSIYWVELVSKTTVHRREMSYICIIYLYFISYSVTHIYSIYVVCIEINVSII